MLGVIGGSGADSLSILNVESRRVIRTPYGSPSDPVVMGTINGMQVLFLPRHGMSHKIPPHAINYRANLWALRECGVTGVIALNAVGAINAKLAPGDLALPDQVVDYTWGRSHTFFDGKSGIVRHVDFTAPYSKSLRERIESAATGLGLRCFTPCCYAATQGPRLETVAEIDRIERDGGDIVGMTGMPEAALARELNIPYASMCVVANMAAGRGDEEEITMEEIERNLVGGIADAYKVIEAAVGE
ncbi:MAG: S-methyl-5'-thioinosine phosphorylase [Proteobacteria bacterium]|nr:MAG: S-methyl-5'-thioinosine phosphorylase [Pseudomonadota bacterium]